jgi:hypothetical protein
MARCKMFHPSLESKEFSHTKPPRADAGFVGFDFVVLELGFIGWIGSTVARNVVFGFILNIL